LRAATLLAHLGYLSEVSTVLRGAYESASVGRYLAHEPAKADRWLEKATWYPTNTEGWIPDREVRQWFGDSEKAYAQMYGILSKGAHPTAASTLPLVEFTEEGYSLKLGTRFDTESFREVLVEVIGMVLWVCFALKNAAPDERALPPEWREELQRFTEEVASLVGSRTGAKPDFSHLQRDWEVEYQQWERLLERVHNAEETERLIKSDPRSWENLKDEFGSQEPT
jgi:hypothetical protein